VTPDVGGIRRARAFASALGTELAIVDKQRPKHGVVKVMNVIGEVKGKRVIIVDDLISTGGTLCANAESLIEFGATEVYACCTHAILASNAPSRIQSSPIKELAVLNTAFLPMEKRIPKLKIISAANIFAHAIYKIHMDEPISVLFDNYLE
jgi:ribose-phosphate pyrophosphokinase